MTTAPLSSVERALLLLIAFTTLVFCAITPPFQVPDEPQHLSRSVRLAAGEVFPEQHGTAAGGLVPRRYAVLSEAHYPREQFGVLTRYTVEGLRAAAATEGDAPVFVEFANVANYAPTLYAPQAVGIVVGDALGLSALGSFYVARFVNALVALALLAMAVQLLPFGRMPLLAVAALPTVAYQAASVSPDATINGLGWLVGALSLAVGYGAAGPARRGWLVAASVPLGLCKGLYAPVALAGIRGRAALWCIAAFVAAAAAFVVWTLAAGGDQAVYVVESRRTGQLVTTAPLSAQLQVVLGDPLGYIAVLASSMAERSPVYALQLGGRFGWNAILLPIAAYALAGAMVLAGVLSGLGRAVPGLSRLWWAVLALGVIILVETALYLTGTPLGADYVQGTQGRYFLPVLPLLLFAVAPASPLSTARLKPERVVLVAACLLHAIALATVVDTFWLNGFTNHRGLPPFAHDAGGVLRLLLLPSPRW